MRTCTLPRMNGVHRRGGAGLVKGDDFARTDVLRA